MTRFIAWLLASAVLFPLSLLAWSNPGHRLIGDLAQRRLTPVAEAQVAELLAGEPEPSLAGVASWADTLRGSDPENYKKTESWHYINFPAATCAYSAQRDCPGGNCVVGQIERQRKILADRSMPIATRRNALKFIVHFVGDLHQPLHASNRSDKGGNGFQISLRTDLKPKTEAQQKSYVDGVMGTNLHSVWDYYLLASKGLPPELYAEQLAARPWPPTPAAGSMEPAAWANESCRLIDSQRLYPKGHKMDSRYLDAHRPLAERQIVISAKRLSDLLNATLVD
ncbi:MAG TPA: S1/P1 nuclease [Pseudoxanthomonas sp.]